MDIWTWYSPVDGSTFTMPDYMAKALYDWPFDKTLGRVDQALTNTFYGEEHIKRFGLDKIKELRAYYGLSPLQNPALAMAWFIATVATEMVENYCEDD